MARTKNPDESAPPAETDHESPAETILFRSLGHPLRRQLLRFINDKNRASYTDLRDTFQLEPGTLYFHLEQLMTPDAPLLTQRADRHYHITPLGQLAANFLNQATDITPSAAPAAATGSHPHLRRITYTLGFAPLFRYLTKRPDHLIIEGILLLAITTYLVTLIPLITIGFLPLILWPTASFIPALAFLGSWVLVTLTTELITRFRYHATQGFIPLLAATIYAWIPQAIYALLQLAWHPILAALPLLTFFTLFFTLTWSLWIFAQAVIHTKRIATRKAALTTIIITNGTLLATILIIILPLFL